VTTATINHGIVVYHGPQDIGTYRPPRPAGAGIKAGDHFVINLDKMNETAPTNTPQDAGRAAGN